MTPVYVRGIGLWSPGYPTPDRWCRGEPSENADQPEAKILVGPLRRRASLLTKISVEAMTQAIAQAGCDPAAIASVWATSHGEHSNGIKLFEMMHRGEGKVSPTLFHNSVHNAASGYGSIACGNRSASTTLTGGEELVASTFLESLGYLEQGVPELVAVVADEPLQPPFDRPDMHAPLSLAFCLSRDARGALAELRNFRRDTVAPVKPYERFGRLYVSAALPLLERVALGQPGTVALELEGTSSGPVWCIDVERV